MKLLLILVFGLLSTVRGQESKPVEHLLFRAKTPLSEAVKTFNEKFSQELGKLNTALLTEDEVRCAFAIGSSFYHYSENNEMAGLCLACYKNGQLPAGSSLALYTREVMGPPNAEKAEKFIFIYLRISTMEYDEKIWKNVPDDKMLKSTANFPVRLLPVQLKK